MSILEKIVQTEKNIEANIKKAEQDAINLISNARDKSNEEAISIKKEADLKIKELNQKLEKEVKAIKLDLEQKLNKQQKELEDLVKSKVSGVVDLMYKEVMAEWLLK